MMYSFDVKIISTAEIVGQHSAHGHARYKSQQDIRYAISNIKENKHQKKNKEKYIVTCVRS